MNISFIFQLTLCVLATSAHAAKPPVSADHVNLDSEHVLLDALAARMDQAVILSRSTIERGASVPVKQAAEREMQRHAVQAKWLRERLRKWYRTDSRRRFDVQPIGSEREFQAALARNHAEIDELIEFGQGLTLRPELQRALAKSRDDCLVLAAVPAQVALPGRNLPKK